MGRQALDLPPLHGAHWPMRAMGGRCARRMTRRWLRRNDHAKLGFPPILSKLASDCRADLAQMGHLIWLAMCQKGMFPAAESRASGLSKSAKQLAPDPDMRTKFAPA